MIGSTTAMTVPRMRAQAESMMVDRCNIDRLTTTWDEGLQKSVTTWAPVHANVPCWLEQPAVMAQALLTGEATTPETPTVHMPVRITGVKPDDRVTFTAVGPESDPGLVDTVVYVTHVLAHTYAIERLAECRWSQ